MEPAIVVTGNKTRNYKNAAHPVGPAKTQNLPHICPRWEHYDYNIAQKFIEELENPAPDYFSN